MSSEITNPGERKLVVVSGRAHPKLAEEIAQALDQARRIARRDSAL